MSAAEASMRIRWARPLAALAVALAGPWLVAATAHKRAESGDDQVIVKFAPQSEAGQILSRMDLAAIADPAGDPRLTEVARDFGARIGFPLRLQGLTSGRELLLALDYRALASALAEGLRQRGDSGGDAPGQRGTGAAPRGRVREGQRVRQDGRKRTAHPPSSPFPARVRSRRRSRGRSGTARSWRSIRIRS
jgi:hypothetical protein